jgi:hypothetical protein
LVGENKSKEAGSSLRELIKAITHPAMTLGMVRGMIILKKVLRGGVLWTLAASSSVGSTRVSPA